MLQLKIASSTDTEILLQAARLHHEEYLSNTFDENTVLQTIQSLVQTETNQACVIILYTEENPCVGFVALVQTTLPFSKDVIASELAWWLHPEHRRGKGFLLLHNAAEYWAKNVAKASELKFGVPSTNDKMIRFFRKKGYIKQEELWSKSWQ